MALSVHIRRPIRWIMQQFYPTSLHCALFNEMEVHGQGISQYRARIFKLLRSPRIDIPKKQFRQAVQPGGPVRPTWFPASISYLKIQYCQNRRAFLLLQDFQFRVQPANPANLSYFFCPLEYFVSLYPLQATKAKPNLCHLNLCKLSWRMANPKLFKLWRLITSRPPPSFYSQILYLHTVRRKTKRYKGGSYFRGGGGVMVFLSNLFHVLQCTLILPQKKLRYKQLNNKQIFVIFE